MATLYASIYRVTLAMLFIAAAQASAQPGSLAGRVSDSAGKPIDGARLELLTTGRRASTDATGRYRLDGLPAGQFDLRIAALGFGSVTRLSLRPLATGSPESAPGSMGISAVWRAWSGRKAYCWGPRVLRWGCCWHSGA